jgi:protein-L-isoaspartate(D-aspartate) O-methyltransferase
VNHRFAALLLLLASCRPAAERQNSSEPREPVAVEASSRERLRMVEDQLVGRDVRDARVLEAMRIVPRHRFVPENVRALAYRDSALPIGFGQTISQPYVVARMTEVAAVKPGDKVLEVGTGSGYQAAVLAAIGADVYTVEIVPGLGRRAAADLERLGYRVHTRIGDGYRGWPEAAPFDAIVVTAAPREVPAPLLEQLATGGRLVIPVGEAQQELRLLVRTATGIEQRALFPVQFVPMTGEAQN